MDLKQIVYLAVTFFGVTSGFLACKSDQGFDSKADAMGSESIAADVQLHADPYWGLENAFPSLTDEEKGKLEILRYQPSAVWFGEWSGDVRQSAAELAQRAGDDKYAQVVVYNIPGRDCGQYSAGGLDNDELYKKWVEELAAGMGSQKAIYILEPDALALGSCSGGEDDLSKRLGLLASVIPSLKKNSDSLVYIDAGHSAWLDPAEVARRLKLAGIDLADGFALNTSNYQRTSELKEYGKKVLAALELSSSKKNFIIDTSRNGNGPVSDPSSAEDSWCNPAGMAIGELPALQAGDQDVFAYLWVKRPGESDGNCNGGPSAGQFWKERAIELVENARM